MSKPTVHCWQHGAILHCNKEASAAHHAPIACVDRIAVRFHLDIHNPPRLLVAKGSGAGLKLVRIVLLHHAQQMLSMDELANADEYVLCVCFEEKLLTDIDPPSPLA